MEFVVFVILAVLFFAAWVCEKCETEETRTAFRRCIAERDEENKLKRKYERENEELRFKCAEFADNESKMRMTIEDLEIKNDVLHMNCEEADSQIAALEGDIEKLRSCTVEYAFSEWERKCCADDPWRVLFERDGVVLIYEGGKVVGWYGADTVQVKVKNADSRDKTRCVEDVAPYKNSEAAAYEAPVDEAIE